jgi:outer membrane protein assembly factor BamB
MERAIAPSGEPVIETAGMTAADDQHLYVITANAELVALNLDGGQVVWRVPLAPQYGDSFLGATLMTDDFSVILNLGSGSHPAEPVGGTELASQS